MDTKSPLKSLQFQAAFFTVAKASFGDLMSTAVRGRSDMLLKRERNFDFGAFDATEGKESSQDKLNSASTYGPTEPRGKRLLAHVGTVDATRTVKGGYLVENFSVNHSDLGANLVDGVFEATLNQTPADLNAALAVEQPREVSVFHQGLVKIAGELGGHPMPGLKRRGRAIPNQALVVDGGFHSSSPAEGVCNEQVPAPKGKVCSELTRNRESEAEMTSPCVVSTSHSVTDLLPEDLQCSRSFRQARRAGRNGRCDVGGPRLHGTAVVLGSSVPDGQGVPPPHGRHVLHGRSALPLQVDRRPHLPRPDGVHAFVRAPLLPEHEPQNVPSGHRWYHGVTA